MTQGYGFIDKTGKEVIPLKYDYADFFSDGLAVVGKNTNNFLELEMDEAVIEKYYFKKYGYIDKKRKEVIPLKYDIANSFHDGLATLGAKGEYRGYSYNSFSGLSVNIVGPEVYTDKNGQGVFEQYVVSTTFNDDGFSVVIKNGKYGVIDRKGNEVIPVQYDDLRFEDNGIAAVRKDGKWGYINVNGEEVTPAIYNDAVFFEKGLAAVKKENKWGYINTKGEEVTPFKYDSIYRFEDGEIVEVPDEPKTLRLAKIGKKKGFIDKNGKEVTPIEYDEYNVFDDGFTMVRKGKNWGCIDEEGKEIIPLKYRFDGYEFCEGLLCIKNQDKKWGYFDKSGNIAVPFVFTEASDFRDGVAVVAKKDKNGKEIYGILKNPIKN